MLLCFTSHSLIVAILAMFLELRLPAAAGTRPLGEAEGFTGAIGNRPRGDRAGRMQGEIVRLRASSQGLGGLLRTL